jgi:aspartyl-tRNA(Asn)/glutamyl-tRNA(Gln) amidotransferase subunit A
LVAYGSSLDHIGVLARRVDDAARLLEVISGHDMHDATSVDRAVPNMRQDTHTSDSRLDGVVVGRPVEYFPDSLDARIRARCDDTLDRLRARGATVRDVSLPHTALAIPVYYIVAPAEASSNLARFDGVRYGLRATGDGIRGMYEATRSAGFGAEVIRRILLGTYVLSAGYYDAYYRRAQCASADRRRLHARVCIGRSRAVHATTHDGLRAWRGVRPVRDVPERHLYRHGESGRRACHVTTHRSHRRTAGWGQLLAAHFDEPTMLRVATVLEDAMGAEAHR